MPSLSDQMLARGAMPLLDDKHGEPILVLTGPDAGKTFIGRVGFEADFNLVTDFGPDNRGKRVVYFTEGMPAPCITASGQQVQRSNGEKWKAVRNPHSGYLETVYELQEIIKGKDQA